MADHYSVEPVVGVPTKTFASDEIAGIDWPFAKMAFGPRDTATEVEDLDTKRLPVKEAKAPTGAVTGVDQNAASVSLLAENANRKGGRLVNASTAVLYVRFEAAAASIAKAGYSAVLNPNQEMPIPESYTGEIRGIWDGAGGGYANITELV
jgi:hypothetical protein